MSNTIKDILLEKIATQALRVGVIGLGYVGLPLAAAFAEAGFQVTGINYFPDVHIQFLAHDGDFID